jgi:hypothetical protein
MRYGGGVRGTIAILGWHGIPYDEVTRARYDQARDAGFTHMMQWAPDVIGVLKVLDCARDAGIKLLIHSPCIEGDNPEIGVRTIKNHPALAMYHLRDEPVAKDLPAIGAIARKIMAEDPKHPCYMNWWRSGEGSNALVRHARLLFVH